MKRPKEDEQRATIYMVKPGVGTTVGTAGVYVGETTTHVVLRLGDGAKGFPWSDVDPVELKETT